MNADVDFFLAEMARHSRQMPVGEARSFLGGLLFIADEAVELNPLRAVYARLFDCDRQLELLAHGQLPLDFTAAEAAAPSSFAERLRAVMTERSLTQANIAEIAGVTQSVVSLWLQGKHQPYKKTLRHLKALLPL